MQLVRSWPCDADMARLAAAGRTGVADDLPRLITSDYDYTALRDIADDVCVIEWDIVADTPALQAFMYTCQQAPQQVRVAAHLLYTVAPEPVWAHRVVTDDQGTERWISEGEEYCDYFAFGLIYLPRAAVAAFLDAPAPERGASPFLLPGQVYGDARFNDQTFSVWHRHRYAQGGPVPVDWAIKVEHLHR